jgi:hypothetical protein
MKTSILSVALLGLPLVLAAPTPDNADGTPDTSAFNYNWQITKLEAGQTNVFSISFAISDLNSSASAEHCGTYGRTQPKDFYFGCSNTAFQFAYSSANPVSLSPNSFIVDIQQLDFTK